jgi:hypothetical protein
MIGVLWEGLSSLRGNTDRYWAPEPSVTTVGAPR